MTRLFDPRRQMLVLGLVVSGLVIGAGCKKAPKKNEGTKSAAMAKDATKAKKTDENKPVADKAGLARRGATAMGAPAAPSAGMGATPPVTGQPRPATGPVKVQLVVGLNAAKLRKTFLWKKLLGMAFVKKLLLDKNYGQIKTALGKDPIQIVDNVRIVLAGQSLNAIKDPKDLAFLVSGSFDASATLKKLQQIPVDKPEEKLVLTKIGGKDALKGKSKGDEFAMVAVNKNTIALCSLSLAETIAKGDITGGNAQINGQLKSVNPKVLAWMVFGGIQLPTGSAGIPALSSLSKIQSGSVVLDAGKPNWKLTNRLDVTTPQAAKSLMQFVGMMKMALGKAGAGGPGAPPPLVGAMLKKLKVTVQGQIVLATLELPEAEVKKLLGGLLKKL